MAHPHAAQPATSLLAPPLHSFRLQDAQPFARARPPDDPPWEAIPMKRMSTSTHGLIDYATSAFIAALPKLAGFGPKVTAILEGSAATSGVYSAMTNYEKGLVHVLPMKAHLTLDALSGGML